MITTHQYTLNFLCAICFIFTSCVQVEKKSLPVSSEGIIQDSTEEIDLFQSQIYEPWDPQLYTRHQYYDFNSSYCYTLKDTSNLFPELIQILSLDSEEKLNYFISRSEEFKNLEALQLVHVKISNAKLIKFLEILATKDHLKKLILYNCGLKEIPPSIDQLLHLETLDFSVNSLTSLPSQIVNLPNLSYLDVGTNRGFTHFPENICDLPQAANS